jgi:protein-disulfide isomerase
MSFSFRRPLRLAAAVSLLAVIAACDSGTASDATAAPGTGATAGAGTAPGRQDWTTTIVATPEGGFRIGNPNAKVKVVEYGSIWCSHCKDFHEAAMPKLKSQYIATGNVSYELRNFVLNGPDLAATLLVRCGGVPTFYRFTDTFFGRQTEWQKAFIELPQAEMQRLQSLPQDRQILAYADAAGLDDFVRPQGITKARFEQCLTNKGEIDRLTDMNNKAIQDYKLSGTPSFLINGEVQQGVASWDALEPKIKAAL